MPSISLPLVMGVTAATGLAGSAINASAAGKAASTQANAETQAAQLMHDQYLQTRGDLLPYNTAGQGATTALQNTPNFNYGAFTFQPTEADIEATPGYQFNLSQGLKSTQNSYAARGLGTSGAAEKGAASFATGLADSTYQNQFQNALNSYTTNYGTASGVYGTNVAKEQNLAGLGENAAAQTGNYGTTTASSIGQTLVGAANASAAGTVGSANAISSGLTGVGNSALSALYANRFFGGGAAPADNSAYYAQGPADLAGLY